MAKLDKKYRITVIEYNVEAPERVCDVLSPNIATAVARSVMIVALYGDIDKLRVVRVGKVLTIGDRLFMTCSDNEIVDYRCCELMGNCDEPNLVEKHNKPVNLDD